MLRLFLDKGTHLQHVPYQYQRCTRNNNFTWCGREKYAECRITIAEINIQGHRTGVPRQTCPLTLVPLITRNLLSKTYSLWKLHSVLLDDTVRYMLDTYEWFENEGNIGIHVERISVAI